MHTECFRRSNEIYHFMLVIFFLKLVLVDLSSKTGEEKSSLLSKTGKEKSSLLAACQDSFQTLAWMFIAWTVKDEQYIVSTCYIHPVCSFLCGLEKKLMTLFLGKFCFLTIDKFYSQLIFNDVQPLANPCFISFPRKVLYVQNT